MTCKCHVERDQEHDYKRIIKQMKERMTKSHAVQLWKTVTW